MEISCTRCHRVVQNEDCYCPYCGLPQFTYEADAVEALSPERLEAAVQDASSVSWKPALRAAILLAIPAGLLSSGVSALSFLFAATAAAFAVTVYVRGQHAPWITMGAGARIGLVTGLLAAWLAFSVSGSALFVERFALNQGGQIDVVYKTLFYDRYQQATNESVARVDPADAAQAQKSLGAVLAWLQSSWGHAGIWALMYAINAVMILLFAAGGGALGARWLARVRRTEL
jgi:RNA polymerase subunit RPABC4/transcription elongation factor Spt4